MKEKNNKNDLKNLVIVMIIFDVIALLNLVLQIYLKDVSYSSYVVLILSNIVVFTTYKYNKKS